MADSMQDSVDRLHKQEERWKPDVALKMLRQLSADLAAAGPQGRLCRKLGANEDGTLVSWFYVIDGNGKQAGTAFDDSFLCPPLCP